jgi:hypothetical protein
LTQRSNDGRKTKTKERTGNIHSRIHTAVRNCAEDLEWCDRLVRSGSLVDDNTVRFVGHL